MSDVDKPAIQWSVSCSEKVLAKIPYSEKLCSHWQHGWLELESEFGAWRWLNGFGLPAELTFAS